MAVTQTTLTAAETINIMKVGGQSDNAVDRKEEAQAILKFANIKLDLFMKTKTGNTEELLMILNAANEADKYMTSGASDITDDELRAYNSEKENSTLGNMIKDLENITKVLTNFQKNLNSLGKIFKKNNAQNNQQIQNIQNSLNSIKKQTKVHLF